MEYDVLLKNAIASGKTQWVRDLLENSLCELDSPNINYQDWFTKAIRVMEERGLIEPSQQKNYLTNIRGAIKLLNPNHPALAVIRFNKETWIGINNKDNDRIAQRITKLLTNPEAIVNKAISLISSHLWTNIAAGLAVLTGRRISEILKSGKFEYKTKYSLIFSGALKRRNESVECIFEIPTLAQADIILEAIARLKQELNHEVENLSLKEVNIKYSRAVSKQCDIEFVGLVPPRYEKDNLYTHLFRAIYATIATHWYCPVTIPEIEYRAAICGHYQILDEKNPELRRSLAASRNYFDYKIADETGNIDGRLGIKLNMPGVKVIEQFSYAIAQKEESTSEKQGCDATLTLPRQDFPSSCTSANSINEQMQPESISLVNNSQNKKYNMIQHTQQIPSFLIPRLEIIAKKLDLSETEAIQIMFNWMEMGLALTKVLEIEEFNPHFLYNNIEQMKSELNFLRISESDQRSNGGRKSDGTSDFTQPTATRAHSEATSELRFDKTSFKHQNEILKSQQTPQFNGNSVEDLCTSVKVLSELLSQQLGLGRHSGIISQGKDHKPSERWSQKSKSVFTEKEQILPPSTRQEINNDHNDSVFLEENNANINATSSVVASPAPIKKNKKEETVHQAIDAVMEYNNKEGRVHHDKWFINVSSLRSLTGRGDKLIGRVLQQRQAEVEQHNELHNLTSRHNCRGRFSPSIQDVISF
ncbi:hypothetical protein NIES4102_41650 (plasmid) [Chondrocystis sp. NIES-4102]|nr:hypothetical protein NIES4102_41650 [Chondrocystis sp. NIES-4102]